MKENNRNYWPGRIVIATLVFGLITSLLLPATIREPKAMAQEEGVWSSGISCVTQRLRAVYYYDTNHGWAVGDSGTVIRTLNGGATCLVQISGVSNILQDVLFINTQEGWIVGNSGYIGHTIDGGETWSKQSSGVRNNLYAIKFKDANNGWIVGDSGLILQTYNGGSSWTPLPAVATQNLRSLVFQDGRNYIICGSEGLFLRSKDGGSTWEKEPTAFTSVTFEEMSFPSPQKGYAVGGRGIIAYTDDGGETWKQGNVPTQQNIYSIYFIDSNNGWIVGDGGTLLHTNDGGESWKSQLAGSSRNLHDIYFSGSKNGWIVGDNGTVVQYTVATVTGPTETSVKQDINKAGLAKLNVGIERFKNIKTGEIREVSNGISDINIGVTYDRLGLSILALYGTSPFDKPDISVNNGKGISAIKASQRNQLLQPPFIVCELYPRITGSSSKSYAMVINFDSIITGSSVSIPQEAPISLTFRRGDARTDNVIDMQDATSISRYLAEEIKKEEINLVNAASVYWDEGLGDRVTIKDALFLAQKVNGIRDDGFLPENNYWAQKLSGN